MMQQQLRPSADVRVRDMRLADADDVVAVHLQSFPGFFLTFLGRAFLTEFYRAVIADRTGVALVAEGDGQIIGLVAGTTEQSGFYTRLIDQRKFRFARAALVPLLRRPKIALRLWRALKRPAESRATSASACLMSIAVLPRAAGAGVGRRLVQEFCAVLQSRGLNSVCLTTDLNGNDSVNAFYRRLGFRVARTFVTPEGRALNEYVHSLQQEQ